MIGTAAQVAGLLYPAVLLAFLALYVTSLLAGTPPELALLRSGGAGLCLALVGRLVLHVLEHNPIRSEAEPGPGAGRQIDVAIGDDDTPSRNEASALAAPDRDR